MDLATLEQRAPAVLLPYQQAWAADRNPVKVCEKSRRIGLSWSEAADEALYAAEDAGDDVWYIGYNKDMAEEFINDCANWAKHYDLAAGEITEGEEIFKDGDEDKSILTFRIKFASGHKIVALSSRPSNLRGKQGRVVIDEAAFHENLGELIKAAMALLMWGGEVRIISTHDGEGNAFNELCNDIRSGKKPYSLHRIDFDQALEQGLYQRICLIRGIQWTPAIEAEWRQKMIDFYGEDAQEELFCIPSKGGGAYLPRALVEPCMEDGIPVLRYEQTDDFVHQDAIFRTTTVNEWCDTTIKPLLDQMDPARDTVFGEDFARSGDLTVIEPLQETQDARWRCPFILELRNLPFEQQKQVLFYLVDHLPRFRHGSMDARGNGQYLAEVAMQRYGEAFISMVMLSRAWYRENMPRYKAAFEDKTIILPRDADIIEDHRAVKKIEGVGMLDESRTTEKGTKNKRHGDTAISGCMAIHATNQEAAGDTEILSGLPRQSSSMMEGY